MKTIKKVALLLALVMLFCMSTGGTMAWLVDESDTVKTTFTVGNIDITLKEAPDTQSSGQSNSQNESNSEQNIENDPTAVISETSTAAIKQDLMIPGYAIEKDPIVTVTKGSEDCYVFVKLDKGDVKKADTLAENGSENKTTSEFDKYMSFEVAEGWMSLKDYLNGKNTETVRPDSSLLADYKDVYYRIVNKNDVNKEFRIIKDGKITVLNADLTPLKAEDVKPLELNITAYAVQLRKDVLKEFTPEEAWIVVQESVETQTTTPETPTEMEILEE